MTIVSRRVDPAREAAFVAWQQRLQAAARAADGFVTSTVQRPDVSHPDEWVVTYQFADRQRLQAWMDSPARARLLEEGADLLLEPPREQVVALDPAPDPVTAVSSLIVPEEHAEQHRALYVDLVEALQTFPGFLRVELFEPVPGVQDETVVVFAFDTRAHLEAWLESDVRARHLERVDALGASPRTLNVLGGFAGWFGGVGERAAAPVRTWKQAAVVLLALYPVSLVLTAVRRVILPDVAWPLGVLFGNALGVAALSWLVMPPLTRRLDRWLRR